MKSIKIGNQIVYEEQICGLEYKKFHEKDVAVVGYKSALRVFTTDGKEIIFHNDDAEIAWKWASARAINLDTLKPQGGRDEKS